MGTKELQAGQERRLKHTESRDKSVVVIGYKVKGAPHVRQA